MTSMVDDQQKESFVQETNALGNAPRQQVTSGEQGVLGSTGPPQLATATGTPATAVHPLLQQLQSSTKVVEISRGRHFVSRPLRYEVTPQFQMSRNLTGCGLMDGSTASHSPSRYPGGTQTSRNSNFTKDPWLTDINMPWSVPTPFDYPMRPIRPPARSSGNTPFYSQPAQEGCMGMSQPFMRMRGSNPRHHQELPVTLELESVLKGSSQADVQSPFMKLLEAYSKGGPASAQGHSRPSTASLPHSAKRTSGGGAQWLFDAAVASKNMQSKGGQAHQGNKGFSGLPAALVAASMEKYNPIHSPSRQFSQYASGLTNKQGTISPATMSPRRNNEWQFHSEEDMVDEEYLYKRDEIQRRKNPRYLAQTKKLYDLHIVLPLCIPSGKIVVDDPQGANYYQFEGEKSAGAHILFGKGVAKPDPPATTTATAGSAVIPTTSQEAPKETKKEAEVPPVETKPEVAATTTDKREPRETAKSTPSKGTTPACDVWASFLHVRLGTIYNLNEDQMREVVDRFKVAFDPDLCRFYVPIAMDCRGVYPSTDELISQRAGRPSLLIRDARDKKSSANERYETRGTPTTENDIKRLRMLRRYLKRFAKGVIQDMGFNAGIRPSLLGEFGFPMDYQPPRPCIELHDNCRTSTLTGGSLKIVIREWSKLNDPEIFKKVWNGRLSSSAAHHGVAEEVWAKLLEQKDIPSAPVMLGEIRLEHNHLRMVDPRWDDELILGRRVADHFPHLEAPDPDETPARFVFCSRVPKPDVVYAYAADGEDPRDAALNSRLSPLFQVHLSKHPTAGCRALNQPKEPVPVVKDEGNTEATVSTEESENPAAGAESLKAKTESFQMMSLKELPMPFIPKAASRDRSGLPQTLQKLITDVSEAAALMLDRSALKDGALDAPISTVTCKFFLKGGCARGNNCYFLHPVDPTLESKLDVRHVIPKHPKFF